MAKFEGEDLSGSEFSRVELVGARFTGVDLRDARLRSVDLRGLDIRDAEVADVRINGEVEELFVNGVDVAPLVQAELDRRYPDRAAMRPEDPDGFRRAWAILERLWTGTVERAMTLPPDRLHERVDDEWSFIETQRHLLFATDAWIRRAIQREPRPWDDLDLPWGTMTPRPGVIPWDREARPDLDVVLALRAGRRAGVAAYLEGLDQTSLDSMTEPVLEPGYPESRSFPVRRCLLCVLNEEWEHRLYAERDLDALGAAPSIEPPR